MEDTEYIDRYTFNEELVITHVKPCTKDIFSVLKLNYPPDKASIIRIILILSGELEITVDYATHHFSANSLVEITPTVMVNNFEISSSFSCYEIMVSHNFVSETVLDKHPIPISHFFDVRNRPGTSLSYEESLTLKVSILRIIHYLKDNDHNYRKEMLHNTMYNFIFEIGNIFINIDKNRTEPQTISRQDKIIKEFVLLLNKYGKTEHSPSFYADKMCISTQYLSLVLKTRSKNTAGNWISSYLITQAKIKLRTSGTTLQEIADELNFADQASFGKFFKKHTGMSPKKYKEEY